MENLQGNEPNIVTCPVCHGHGTVSKPPRIAGDQNEWIIGITRICYSCNACKGNGVIDAREIR